MAENLKAIKEQIGSVANLKKITRAMEMVARSKMKRAIDSAVATRSYTQRVLGLLYDLSDEEAESTNVLLNSPEAETELVIHIASEKGLCGGYNAQALRRLQQYLSGKDRETVHVVSVGKYAARHVEKVGAFHLQNFTVGDTVQVPDAKKIAEFIIERFESGTYKQVHISYANFETVFSQKPVVAELLPVTKVGLEKMIRTAGSKEEKMDADAPAHPSSSEDYRYEPSKEAVLESILPGLITAEVFQALLEAGASEQSSRMVAMKGATDNASKVGEALTLRYNRARQASITREIIEIAAGADAV